MNRTQTTLSKTPTRTRKAVRADAPTTPSRASARIASRSVAKTVAARARDAEKRRGTIEERVKAMRARENTARLWKAILDQDEFWVPKGAWTAFGEASIRLGGVIVRPEFTVDGVIKVADMDASYRRATVSFIWRKSAGIVSALAWTGLFDGGGPYDHGRPDDFNSDASLFALARDEVKRRDWFNQLPLIVQLNEGIIAERNARIQRPTDLDDLLMNAFFPPKKTTDSGILLP